MSGEEQFSRGTIVWFETSHIVQVVLQAFILKESLSLCEHCTWFPCFMIPFDPNLWIFPHYSWSAISSCCCPTRYRSFWTIFSVISWSRQSLSSCSTTHCPCHMYLELTCSEQQVPRLYWTLLVGNPLIHRMKDWNDYMSYPASGKGAALTSADTLAGETQRSLTPASICSRKRRQHLQVSKLSGRVSWVPGRRERTLLKNSVKN